MLTPAVSVVCATYRRPAAVGRLLDALAAQELEASFEVVLSDDGSGPEVRAELERLAAASPLPVRLTSAARNQGAATARNAGWRLAHAPVVAFTDDDCQPVPGWLRHGVAALPARGVVVGAVRPNPAQADHLGVWSRSLTVSDARYFQTANAFYRRQDLEAVGGFDTRLARGGEDTDLGLRVLELGGTAVFCPDALVMHDVRRERPSSFVREAATRWVDLALVAKKHPQLRAELLYHRWFWKRSHPPTLAALVGLASGAASPWFLLLVLPWLRERGYRHPSVRPRAQRLRWLPWTFLVDAAEVLGCVRGSLRHRSVLL